MDVFNITYGVRNATKVAEIDVAMQLKGNCFYKRHIKYSRADPRYMNAIIEISNTTFIDDFKKNAYIKAIVCMDSDVYGINKMSHRLDFNKNLYYILTDDNGIYIDHLGKWFYSSNVGYSEEAWKMELSGILEKLNGVENRKAVSKSVICLMDVSSNDVYYFEGIRDGRVVDTYKNDDFIFEYGSQSLL